MRISAEVESYSLYRNQSTVRSELLLELLVLSLQIANKRHIVAQMSFAI